MGNCDARIVATISRRLAGQLTRAPSAVFDQSLASTSAAISPTAAESGSGVETSGFVLDDIECRQATVQARKSGSYRPRPSFVIRAAGRLFPIAGNPRAP